MPLAAVVFNLALRQPAACPPAAAGDVQVCGRGASSRPDNVIPILVNGRRGTMLVDPGGPRTPVCNPDFAVRARFVESGLVRIGSVGPVNIDGRYGRISIESATRRIGEYAFWSAQHAVEGADCWMGPEALGVAQVTFRLGPARADATTAKLRVYHGGDRDLATDGRIDVGGWSLQVRFDAIRDPTALSASATLAVAPALGASIDGPVERSDILFGIARPIRRLRLHRPLVVGPLALDRLYARVADYGDAGAVQSVDADELDPGDVVVTGRKLHPGRSRIVRIGRSDLARCDAISFDFDADRIVLTC